MPWVTRRTINAQTGFTVLERVWVEPAVSVVAATRRGLLANQSRAAAAKARADSAAKVAAANKAKLAAEKQAKAALRSRMWSQLQQNAARGRNAVRPPTTGATSAQPAVTSGSAAGGHWVSGIWVPDHPAPIGTPGAPPRPGTPEFIARARANDANSARYAAAGLAYTVKTTMATDKADFTKNKGKPGDSKAARVSERILKNARDLQSKTKGATLDGEFVGAVYDDYRKHVDYVRNHFERVVTRINGLLKVGKDGKYYFKDPVHGRAEYNRLLHSTDYGLQHEYTRLFYGKNDKTKKRDVRDKGSYAGAIGALQTVGDYQRRLVRDQAREQWINGASGPDEAIRRINSWNTYGKWDYEASMADIDPAKTGMITVRDKKTGRMVTRHRTVQEEYEFLKGQNKTFLSQQRALYDQQLALMQKKMAGDRLKTKRNAKDPGYSGLRSDARDLTDAARSLGMQDAKGNLVEPQSDAEMRKLVDGALDIWDNKYKHLWQTESGKKTSTRNVIAGGFSRGTYAAYLKARKAQEKRLYGVFHADVPFDIDKLGIPLLKPATQLLGAGAGLVGTLARLEVASGGNFLTRGVFDALTGGKDPWGDVGNNTSKIGGVEPQIGQAPPEVAKIMDEAEAKYYADLQRRTGLSKSAVGMTHAAAAGQARIDAWYAWKASPAGQTWYRTTLTANKAASAKEDASFFGGVYGPTGFWEKLDAISEYGSKPTTSALLNLAAGFVTDPTVALPLNFTTWLSRAEHVAQVTEGMSRMKRLGVGVLEFQRVTEPQLRFTKQLKPILERLGKGEDAEVIAREILEELAGVAPGSDRALKTREIFEKWGIDPASANGHLLLSQAQEVIIKKLADAGLDYRSVAERAALAEAEVRKTEKAAKDLMSAKATEVDARTVANRKAAEEAAATDRAKLATERETSMATIETRASEQVIKAEHQAEPILEREAAGPGLGHEEPEYLAIRDHDPMRRIATDGGTHRAAQGQTAADIVHHATGAQDVLEYHGVQFAKTPDAEAFLKSDEYKQLDAILTTPVPGEGRVRVPGLAGERIALARQQREAMAILQQIGHESVAERNRELEGFARVSRKTGATQPSLRKGVIPWATTRAKQGVAYAVEGGRKAHEQYIASNSDLLVGRMASRTPQEEMSNFDLRRAVEGLKQRLVYANSRLEMGKEGKRGGWTQAQYDAEIDDISQMGVYRRSADLTVDVRSGDNQLIYASELDHVRSGLGGVNTGEPIWVPIGQTLVEDYMAVNELGHYYETLSLLPGLNDGAGYTTALMRDIMDPTTRNAMTRVQFARILRSRFFTTLERVKPGPMEFREASAHLFALFHLKLADAQSAFAQVKIIQRQFAIDARGASPEELARLQRQMAKDIRRVEQEGNGALWELREYSKSVEVLLEHDPNNIYGRMWKVMESRAGVSWADPHVMSEDAFMRTILEDGYPLHPNLALAMIPYGPIARNLPITHGFTGHLRNMATTTSRLFQASLPRWDDEVVIAQMQMIARRVIDDKTGIMKATQIAHYVASRYGNSLRRSRFGIVLNDFSIEASAAFRRGEHRAAAEASHAEFKRRWIEAAFDERRMWTQRRLGQQIWNASDTVIDAATRADLEKEFERYYAAKVNVGARREFTPAFRRLYDDMYWAGEITHDNPGLHTAKFLERMADPTLQRGDSWVRYASAYWDHMVVAGAESEAREVLGVIFESEIRTAKWDAFEALTKAGGNLADATTSPTWRRSGHINELLLRTGLMRPEDAERIVEEGLARARDQHLYAEQEVEQAVRNDELLLEDTEAAALREDAGSHMYDMATVERQSAAAQRAAGTMTEASEELRKLSSGTTTLDEAESRLASAGQKLSKETDKAAIRAAKKGKQVAGAVPADLVAANEAVRKAEQLVENVGQKGADVLHAERAVEEADALYQYVKGEVGRGTQLDRAREALKQAKGELDAARLRSRDALPAAQMRLDQARGALKEIEAREFRIKEGVGPIPGHPDDWWVRSRAAAVTKAQEVVDRLKAHGALEEAATSKVALAESNLSHLRGAGKGSTTQIDNAVAALKKVQDELDALKAHADSPSRLVSGPASRPSEARMKAYYEKFYTILNDDAKGGEAAALRYLATLPKDARVWMSAEIKATAASRELGKMFNSVVHRTIDMGSIPEQVASEMEDMVAVVKAMPGGKRWLTKWADAYYSDLLQTRLIDYIKNEDWFRQTESAVAENEYKTIRMASDDATTRLGKAREKLRAGLAKDPKTGGVRPMTTEERGAAESAVRDLEAEVSGYKTQMDEITAGRTEGQMADAPAGKAPGYEGTRKQEAGFIERQNKDRAQRLTRTERELPFAVEVGEGWKAHLGFDLTDEVAKTAIENAIKDLVSRGLVKGYKFGRNAGQAGKDATIYVGSRDAVQFVAEELDRLVGHHLYDPTLAKDIVETDVELSGKVWGRFDVGGLRGREMDMHQYGVEPGIPSPNLDIQQLSLKNPDPNFTEDAIKARSRGIIQNKYGDFFSGTRNPKTGELRHEPPAYTGWTQTTSPLRVVRPDPNALNSVRVGMSQKALEILQSMDEETWLRRELNKAYAARRKATTGEAKQAAVNRQRAIKRALSVVDASKPKAGETVTTLKNRRSFVSAAKSLVGDRAKAVFAPKYITAYVGSAAGLEVEQGRSLYRLFRNSVVDPAVRSRVRGVTEVSRTYRTHGAAIEREFSVEMTSDLLKAHGFPEDTMSSLTPMQFITNLDEFGRALRNPEFSDFVRGFTKRMDKRLWEITGDRNYTIEQMLSDRLLVRSDHFDSKLFEEVEQKVSDAIAAERQGAKRMRRTDLRRVPGDEGANPLSEMIETDIRAVIAKAKVLGDLGIDPHAYNEARKVLRGPLIRKRYGQQIVAFAEREATNSLMKAGMRLGDKGWDEAWKIAYDEKFLARRQVMADEEAIKMLEQLATEEMYGATYTELIEEFERRYSMDQEIKGTQEASITPFQQRTLEEAVKTHLGVTNLDDVAQMQEALQRHGQHPPFENRQLMRDWLVKYGFWSPRTSTAIEAGKRSWDIFEESKFYKDSWGYVPEWANPDLLEEGGEYYRMLFDENWRGEVFRNWGLFNRNMESRYLAGEMTRGERARFMVEGSVALGLKGRRDLELERRYVMERYGRLVTDDAGNLTAFPELMNRSELRTFILNRTSKDALWPPGVMKTVEQLDVMHMLMEKHVGRYLDEKVFEGKTVEFADVFEVAANVVHDMLLDPMWLKRDRDALGQLIRGQANLRRSLIFTQLGFLTTNVIDTFIKGPWTAFTTRSFWGGELSERAAGYGLIDFGFKPHGQLLHDIPISGTDRWKQMKGMAPRYYMRDGVLVEETAFQRKMAQGLQAVMGASELPLQASGSAEDFMKLRLAQRIYDGAYEQALKRLGGDEALADAFARRFAGSEASRLWPTAGDGPYEQLFNQLSPFMSYQIKNRLIFMGEFLSHPFLFNYFDRIGDFIQQNNEERWAKEHPGQLLDPSEARLLELPWAPGVFIDVSQWSDGQRGVKPLYDLITDNGTGMSKASVGSLASQFVRLAGANDINMIEGIMNSLNFGQRLQWVQIKDEEGNYTGKWEQVISPLEAPWGGTANWLNSFWPVEVGKHIKDAMERDWSPNALTVLAYQTAFFGGIKEHDFGAGMNSFYYALRSHDPEAAQEWLDTTADGASLRMWWADKAPRAVDWYTPQIMKDLFNPPSAKDPNSWLHTQTKAFQDSIHSDLEALDIIRRKWNNVIWKLTPGTKEYADAKLRRNNERFQFFVAHPELYHYYAFTMSPQEWAKQQDDWVVDDLADQFYNLQWPNRDDFKTQAAYIKKRDEIARQKQHLLDNFPKLKERIGTDRNIIEATWTAVEDGWFTVLDKIGTRQIAIDAAKQSKNYPVLDQLYLANQLDYKTLGDETAVDYFDPTTDFKLLGKGKDFKDIQGPPEVRKDPFGHSLIPRVKLLPDFNRWRFDRMTPAKKRQFFVDQRFSDGMSKVIAAAKKAPNYGKAFVDGIKADPWLMHQYFERNPGTKERWGTSDSYFRLISRYGILAKQGKFTEAGHYFDNLPDWVKNRYYAKHPERRQKAQRNLQYMNYMKRWTNFYQHRDYAGGAKFFDRLPQWVKDQYYGKHPDGFGKGAHGSSPYSKAMGHWVKLLQDGDKEGAKKFFDTMPAAFRKRYYEGHPEAKLRNNIKRTGQLGEYFGSDDATRAQYLKDNPSFAKWLKEQGGKDGTRRMLIMAGYQTIKDPFLKRIYREKYPEVFSPEAKGAQSLKKTYTFLAEHPEMQPAFKRWLEAVLASYAEELKHVKAPPRPLDVVHLRQHGLDTVRPTEGRSATWVRLHSVG